MGEVSEVVKDLGVNLAASLIFLVVGILLSRGLLLWRTRSTRKVWRSLRGPGSLLIALTSVKGPHASSGIRTSMREVQALAEITPVLARQKILYRLSESSLAKAAGATRCNLLVLGGPNSNELSREALSSVAGIVEVDTCDRSNRSFKIFGESYAPSYANGGDVIDSDFGVVLKIENPFSSNTALGAIIVAGMHGLGTAGAARVLTDEHLARRALKHVDIRNDFVIVVSSKAVGGDYAVKIRSARNI